MERLESDGVVFADGTREEFDAIIWATGYRISFPFFDDPELIPEENQFPLYKRIVKPGYTNLYFLGLAQPLPTLVNFAEQQSKLVAAHLAGDYAFPPEIQMRAVIATDERRHRGHFYDAPRHTMQVDFNQYVTDLLKEIGEGMKRKKVLQ